MSHKFDICMLVHNGVSNDGRVIKEAPSLAAAGWRVVVIGIELNGDSTAPTVEELSGFTIWRVMPRMGAKQMPGTWGKLLRLLAAIPATIGRLRAAKARVYHGHDFPALVFFALAGIWRRPIIYDSHELFFDRWPAGSDYPLLKFMPVMRLLERILARRSSALITVSEPIADILSKQLTIPHTLVVMNAVDLRLMQEPIPLPRQPGQRIVAHRTGGIAPVSAGRYHAGPDWGWGTAGNAGGSSRVDGRGTPPANDLPG